jgi:hypothetical protein
MTKSGGSRLPCSRLAAAAAGCALLALAACATAPPPAPPRPPAVPMDRCEACHNSTPHPGCDGVRGTADDAPNVMGDGKVADGKGKTPKAFDDGTFGFTVNGHGANGTAAGTPVASFNPDLGCTACHDISTPQPGTHFNCVNDVNRELNTLQWPGKPADTRNANTSHLVAGYLPEAGSPQERQVAFDDHCAYACHRDARVDDMRHSYVNGNIDLSSKTMEFNSGSSTTDDPKQDRGLDRSWTPWTIDDLTKTADADPPRVRYYGTCVSCHNPHGTATQQKTRGTNRMVLRNWQDTSMPPFCSNICHKVP